MPSHHTSPSSVSATLVKMTFACSVSIALGLVSYEVPGRDAEVAGLGIDRVQVAVRAGLIHAMSSPTVVTFQPSKPRGGISIAKLVLPQALGKRRGDVASSRPSGDLTPRISMCSASQPSSRPMTEAMRSAKHFLPSSALPP